MGHAETRQGSIGGILTTKADSEKIKKYESLLPLQHRQRYYFGGGSVDAVLPGVDFTYPRSWKQNNDNGSENDSAVNGNKTGRSIGSGSLDSLVHGTIHFRGIVSLLHGFREIDSLGGIDRVRNISFIGALLYSSHISLSILCLSLSLRVTDFHQISLHSRSLGAELVRRLTQLRHGNGKRAVIIYGAWANFDVNENQFQSLDVSEKSIGQTDTLQQSLSSIETKLRNAPGPTVAIQRV